MSKSAIPGINIQWPISELILSRKKTIETRTYPIPSHYLNRTLYLVETPGKNGKFKARVRGTIVFTDCFEYENKSTFYNDVHLHHVTPDSEWSWKDKPKWGWQISEVTIFQKPKALKGKRGIVFTKCLLC